MLTKENAFLYRQCAVATDTEQHFELLVANPKQIGVAEYQCIYHIVGKKSDLTFSVSGRDRYQTLLLALFNAYSTALANGFNPSFSQDSKEKDPGLEKFRQQFNLYLQPKIILP